LAGSNLYGLQLAKQLKEKAREASMRKAEAESRLQKAESILEFCKKINADTEELEKAIAEVVAALDSKDFTLADSKAEQASERAKSTFSEKIFAILDGAESISKLILDLGGKTDELEKQISETKSALEGDDFEESIKLAEKSWDTSQKALHEHYANAYSRAQQILMKTKEGGEETADLERELTGTKSMIESQDYSSALSTVKNVLETASDMLRSRISSDLDSVEDSIITAEDLGVDIGRISDYVKKARSLLTSGDFDEAVSYSRRAQSECEKTVSGKLQQEIRMLKEEIRTSKKHGVDVDEISSILDDAQRSIKDKEVSAGGRLIDKARSALKESQFQIVLQAIARSRDRFVLAKKMGVDISGAIELLNESREKLRKGRFEEALNAAEESEREIENALSAFKEAKNRLEELVKLKKAAEEIGIDLSSEQDYLAEAKDALAGKDFAQSRKRAETGLEAIKKLLKKSAEEKVSEAEDVIAIANQMGLKVPDAEKLLKTAYDSLGELSPEEAHRSAGEAIEATKKKARKRLEDIISSLREFLEGVAESIDVEAYNSQLETVMDLFESENFVEAFNRVDTIKQELSQKGKDECRRLIGDAEIRIDSLEASGVDASDLRLMISKAEEQFGSNDFEHSAATAKEAIKDADEALQNLAKKTLFTLKKALEEAHSNAMNTTKWRAIFKQSKKMFDSSEYVESYQTSKKTLDEIGKTGKERQKIISRIEHCEELLVEAKKNRIGMAAQTDEIERARKALEALDLVNAQALLDEAEKGIENAMAMYLAAKLIIVLKSSIEYANREEVYVDSAKSHLENAKSLMKERNYADALTAAKQGQQEMSEAFREVAFQRISDIQSLIADARNVGVDIVRPQKLLEKAQAEFEEGDFETSLKSAMIAASEIDQIKELSSKSAIEIRISKERIRDAEAIGLDMSGPRSTLEQAIDSLNSHKYAISFELSRKAGAQALESIEGSLGKLFENISSRISSAGGSGADIERAEALLEEAKKAFDTVEIQDSIRILMDAEKELDRADLQYDIAKNSLEMASSKIKEATNDSISLGNVSDILAEAQTAMEGKEFSKVIELSIAIGDEIDRNKSKMDSCHLDINSLSERLERLKRVGLDLDVAEELLRRGEEHLQNGDFVSCRETCIEGERAISVGLEKIIREKIAEADGLIETAKNLGVSEREFRDMLAVASTSAKEGLWDFAIEQTQKCKSKTGDAIRSRLLDSIDDIRSKSLVVKKTGASVGMIEERLKKAEAGMDAGAFDEAFKIVLDAEELISKVESLHREYLDSKYAAESAIAVAKKFGIPTKDSERLMAMADIEQEKDYGSAIELIREATESARSSLDKFNPDIVLSIKPTELKKDQPGKITVSITNKGKALAKDLQLDISSKFEVVKAPKIPQIRGGQTESIEIEVVPDQAGDSKFGISITAKRLFDGMTFDFSSEMPMNVKPGEPTAKLARATSQAKCSSCNGKIKPGFDIVICNRCKNVQHLACAKRNNRCGNCSAQLYYE